MSTLPSEFKFGEAEGWRAWTVIGPPTNPRLMSQFAHVNVALDQRQTAKLRIWPTRDWMVARCPKAPLDEFTAITWYAEHRTPNPDCTCGIYAARTRQHLLDLTAQGIAYQAYTRDRLAVIGRCGLSGRVIEHVNGFKAAKARVLELFVPAGRWDYAEALGDLYGVPVVLDNTWNSIVSEHGTRLGRR